MMLPKVFISYAHEDREWCQRLQQHLGGLHHQGKLAVWADDQIMAGEEWKKSVIRELDEAAVIVLIVSPAFLSSAFCQTIELKRAMERHSEGSARILSIIADHCHWANLPISELQARPQDESRNLKPLVDWVNANVPLAAIAKELDQLTRSAALALAATYSVRADGIRLVEQGGRHGLVKEGSRQAVAVPAEVVSMVAWVLKRHMFVRRDLNQAFPAEGKAALDRFIQDMERMVLIAKQP